MDIIKTKTLKEFKTAFKKQYRSKDILQNTFMVAYYPMLLLVSKKKNSIIWVEIGTIFYIKNQKIEIIESIFGSIEHD